MKDIKRPYEFDPDKARFLIKKAGAVGEAIILTSRDAYAYMHQTGEIVHAMLSEVGLKVQHEIHPYSVLKQKWQKGEYHLDSTANSYRPDPDAWYGRNVYSKSATTKLRTGYVNEKADKLILEAQQTLDKAKRLELYQAVEVMVNEDVPMLYTHYIPLLEAGVKSLKGYAPAFAGPYSTQGAGLRASWMS
jgi:peptide/nickel transport system substrate-binding protein